jgi:hypothetical protein
MGREAVMHGESFSFTGEKGSYVRTPVILLKFTSMHCV